jgi:phosphohistidine phosphatase SixA
MKKWIFALATLLAAAAAQADEALWRQLKQGGHVLLIRHAATEPGTGDPAGFKLGDCATQRNLSEAGREEARRLGRLIKFRAVSVEEVRASQWCRTQETARLAFGEAQPWDVLNSLYADPKGEARLVQEVTALAASLKPPRNLALVTHNFNIRALTGVSPAPAEIVVVKSAGGKLELVGRIPAPGGL